MHRLKKKKKNDEKTQNPRYSQSRTLHTTGRDKAQLIEAEYRDSEQNFHTKTLA